MLQNAPEVNSIGGGGFGFGSGGLLEGIILASLLGRGKGILGGSDSSDLDASGIAAKVVELQNSTNILAEIGRHRDSTTNEFRGIGAGLFSINDAVKDGNYAAAIQAERNTNELSTQATAFAVAASREAGTNTAAIIAKLNNDNEQMLRDRIIALELASIEERRRHDDEKVTIINTNNNTNVLTAIQLQREENDRRFSTLFSQQAKAGQDIIAVGSLLTGTTQTANPVNVKS